MKFSIKKWMKNPAKYMKKAQGYRERMSATSRWIQEWSQTPEGQERLKKYLLKHGYSLDENGKWVKNGDGAESQRP